YWGSNSGLPPVAELGGAFWLLGMPCGVLVLCAAGVLFLLAPVPDCVGGVPVCATAVEITSSRRRFRGTRFFTRDCSWPGLTRNARLVLSEMLLDLAEFAP